MNELVIANTIFEKTWTQKWTHSIDGRKRTIDYILIEKALMKYLIDAEATDILDLGSDHRAVTAALEFGRRKRSKVNNKKDRKAKLSMKGWQPVDDEDYIIKLKQHLHDKVSNLVGSELMRDSLEHCCEQIEEALAETSKLCAQSRAKMQTSLRSSEKLKALREERKTLRASGQPVTEISKSIQKEIKILMRRRARKQIGTILSEFRGLEVNCWRENHW
jgi:hypothetical protein